MVLVVSVTTCAPTRLTSVPIDASNTGALSNKPAKFPTFVWEIVSRGSLIPMVLRLPKDVLNVTKHLSRILIEIHLLSFWNVFAFLRIRKRGFSKLCRARKFGSRLTEQPSCTIARRLPWH
jgi:hypothetical protein